MENYSELGVIVRNVGRLLSIIPLAVNATWITWMVWMVSRGPIGFADELEDSNYPYSATISYWLVAGFGLALIVVLIVTGVGVWRFQKSARAGRCLTITLVGLLVFVQLILSAYGFVDASAWFGLIMLMMALMLVAGFFLARRRAKDV
jgi:hypothetical protein